MCSTSEHISIPVFWIYITDGYATNKSSCLFSGRAEEGAEIKPICNVQESRSGILDS